MPDRPATYRDLIQHEAESAGIPAALAFAVVDQESSGVDQPGPDVPGQGRAQGFFQLMPETARRYGVDPTDPIQNIRGGIRMLSDLKQQYGGDVERMLLAYHGGQDPRNHGPVTQAYVQKVLGRLQGGGGGGDKRPDAQPAPQPSGRQVRGFRADPAASAAAIGAPPPAPLPSGAYGQPPPTALGALAQSFEGPSSAPMAAVQNVKSTLGPLVPNVNPFEREGRKNLAATIGGVGAGLLAAGTTGPGAFAAAPAGAGIATGLETSIENWIGNGPPQSPTVEAAKQAGLEVGGGLAAKALWAIPKRVVASKVAKAAAQKIIGHRDEATAALTSGLDQANRLLSTRSRQQAGEAARDVVQGPARTTLQQLGEAVGAAAETGPDLPTAPLRERIQELAAQISPTGAPKEATVTVRGVPVAASTLGLSLPPLPPDHPLPGVLAKISDALGDQSTIPFAEAHKIKRLLDEAVDWESPAKKLVGQASKGLRNTLRDQMTGHSPYDAATGAYADTVKLFTGKYGTAIRKLARDEPGQLIDVIKPTDANRVRQLRELLQDVAGQQGDEAAVAGQQAWDNVRAAWTSEKVIGGDPTGLSARLAKLKPDFVNEFYRADASGRGVYDNLRQIGAAYDQALAQGKLDEAAFKGSSIYVNKQAAKLEAIEADVIRAIALGPGTFWGAYSIGRLLKGPSSKDLITYAAYSPERTQLFVRMMTGNEPGMALAQLLRGMKDEVGGPWRTEGEARASAAEASRSRVGVPPPTLTRRLSEPGGAPAVGQPPPSTPAR